mmetsp:Transcript_19136/g.66547  ORF Transcript_19136/g.66547 Transcript_19136/m.66547 type:complete len:314 (-) Transcript_19136:257-1198(-)
MQTHCTYDGCNTRSTASAANTSFFRAGIGNLRPTTRVDAIVRVEIADELEMLLESGVVEHPPRVPADWEHLALLDRVVSIQLELVWADWACALVDNCLAVVLAVALKAIQLPEPVRSGEELDTTQLALQLPVLNRDHTVLHEPGILESARLREVLEVVPVQCSGDALAPQHSVLAQALRDATVGIDIAEVELTAGLQQPVRLLQHALLVWAQVDHAVAHDHIETLRFQAQLVQTLDVAQLEVHVAVTELVRVPAFVGVGDVELLLRHVHAHDAALGPDELRGDVDVAAGAAAEVEDREALDVLGQAKPTAIVL